MAHLIDKADRCTMCGTADWEWQANREAYIPVMRDCWGCKLKDAFRVGEGDQIAAGRSVVLISREEADRLAFDPTVPRHGPGRRRSRQRSETK